ncbi:translin isoform X1 [Peromyscus eremicus]|uniref:translin isoform X1 n=1 Tax=Peromyscus eremicus TaxID=42410 RepID=UPI0027DAF9C4|nr:translin isoform X1 [Peromyscus eremicus]
MSVSEIFVELQGFLAAEQDIREEIRKVVQSLEQTAREILTLLQGVHQGTGFQDIPKRCLKAREHFGTVKTHLTSLKTKFPAEQYYRFHEHWRFVLQRLVFLAAFVVYLETETLVTREAVTEILGIEPDREKGFHLDVEDYLSGVLILASELMPGILAKRMREKTVYFHTASPTVGVAPATSVLLEDERLGGAFKNRTKNKITLCNTGWPRTHCVGQASLELRVHLPLPLECWD